MLNWLEESGHTQYYPLLSNFRYGGAMAGFVAATIGRNTHYIRHTSAIGCNTMFIWRIFNLPS